jgi:dihydrofolate synthase/folylpolyglutamate synthase
MRDKAIGEVSEILFPLADRILVTQADNPRAATPEEIVQAAARTNAEMELAADVPSALQRAQALAGTDGVVIVTGSIYVVGEAMRLLGVPADAE